MRDAQEGAADTDTPARYIRSTIPLDDLERRARFPPVDIYGHTVSKVVINSTRG